VGDLLYSAAVRFVPVPIYSTPFGWILDTNSDWNYGRNYNFDQLRNRSAADTHANSWCEILNLSTWMERCLNLDDADGRNLMRLNVSQEVHPDTFMKGGAWSGSTDELDELLGMQELATCAALFCYPPL
jgi:hypothetical protein